MLDYTNALDRAEACDTLIDWIVDDPMMPRAAEMLDVLNRLRPNRNELEDAEE